MSPFSTPVDSISGYMFVANLVIPAQICDKLLCGQGKVYRQMVRWRDKPGRQTDRHTQAMIIPLRPERPRGN